MAKRGAHTIGRGQSAANGRRPAHAPLGDGEHGVERTWTPLHLGSRTRAVLSIACAALCAAVLWCSFSPPTEQEMENASYVLQDVMVSVDQANGNVVALSELLAGEMDDQAVERARTLLEDIGATDAELEQAQIRLYAIGRDFRPGDDTSAAILLEQGVQGRRDMIAYGTVVLDALVRTHDLSPKVRELWQALLDGHAALDESARQLKVGTTPAVKQALSCDQRARESYQRALALMDEAAQGAGGYGFDTERSYAEKQDQAAAAAIQTDEALLAGDTQGAQQHMGAYQSAADEAAAIAKSLPKTADDLLESIYYSLGTPELSIADAAARYAQAAQETARSDGELANYRTSKGNRT